MDTNAYLTRQGWRGTGHSLHPSGHGIKQPLLLSRKNNTLGVGKKVHDAHADQWWSRAFDETLRSISRGKKLVEEATEATPIHPSILASRWGGTRGLYGNFVRGDGLKGTIGAKQEVANYEIDHERSIKKRRLHKTEAVRRDQEERSTQQALAQQDGDLQTPRTSVGIVEFMPTRPFSTGSDVDGRLVAKATLPQEKTPIKNKNPVVASPDDHVGDPTMKPEAKTEQNKHVGISATAPSHATGGGLAMSQRSHAANEQRRGKRGGMLEQSAVKISSTDDPARSASGSEKHARKMKKKRRKEKDQGKSKVKV
ncbi:MAG: hypothetical protein L6R39_000429 [Caloplaca ligustica]|nr:MAG: hypothetical protein L6R39_000429 [Caloplaca ligustica]